MYISSYTQLTIYILLCNKIKNISFNCVIVTLSFSPPFTPANANRETGTPRSFKHCRSLWTWPHCQPSYTLIRRKEASSALISSCIPFNWSETARLVVLLDWRKVTRDVRRSRTNFKYSCSSLKRDSSSACLKTNNWRRNKLLSSKLSTKLSNWFKTIAFN